ncbi:MAG: DNA helicase II [Micavibrio sp.]|nr:DNA helicase II [Micavibrio sp.]
MQYLESLNPPQREAVETTEGPLLVLAGAGTGKTRVLTTRLAHILSLRKATPHQIMAVTFTNKAASEMRERVSSLLGGLPVEGWWLGTFHALCVKMLRRHAKLVGLESNFTIIDTDDQVRLIKQLMEAENLDTKKWNPKMVASLISDYKDKAKKPSELNANDVGGLCDGKLITLYRQYQSRLRVVNACDFGDLLLHMITIFKDPENKQILDQYRNQFQYILVDEYQDTNVAQYLWLRLLAMREDGRASNICCVGDDDQSIYGWRGAEVGNILRFEQDFPGAKIIKLEQNYRSTKNILAAASHVIAENESRLGKTLWAEAEEGEKLIVKGLWDGAAEARFVGEEIESLHSKKHSLNDIAILVRAGFQTREFEERFMALSIPYKVIGGLRFYERAEIRDALAYFRVTAQPNDDLALERIINTPKRGLGASTIQMLQHTARASQISLYEAIRTVTQTDELRPKVKETLIELVDKFDFWRDQMSKIHHCELAKMILDESGYVDMWKQDKAPDSPGRLENLKELVSAMEEFESFSQFLEHVSLVMENQQKDHAEMVTIMTLHGAKGLEFPIVFLPGWEEGLFPSQRSMDETGLKGLEEERRLAYVGITRARERLYISHAANRMVYGKWVNAMPSRFLAALPDEVVDVQNEVFGRSSHWDSSGQNNHRVSAGADPLPNIVRPTTNDAGDTLAVGARIFHDKFGYGKILHIDGNKIDISFEKAGRKRVLKNFIKKA